MMDEQLIDEVAQHAVIYNRQKYYLNGSTNNVPGCGNKYETKDEAWQVIALKLRSDVETCKKRWKYLRERYVSQRKQGDPPVYEHLSRPYLEKMKFLDQHIQPRKSYRNVPSFLTSPHSANSSAFGDYNIDSKSNGSIKNMNHFNNQHHHFSQQHEQQHSINALSSAAVAASALETESRVKIEADQVFRDFAAAVASQQLQTQMHQQAVAVAAAMADNSQNYSEHFRETTAGSLAVGVGVGTQSNISVNEGIHSSSSSLKSPLSSPLAGGANHNVTNNAGHSTNTSQQVATHSSSNSTNQLMATNHNFNDCPNDELDPSVGSSYNMKKPRVQLNSSHSSNINSSHQNSNNQNMSHNNNNNSNNNNNNNTMNVNNSNFPDDTDDDSDDNSNNILQPQTLLTESTDNPFNTLAASTSTGGLGQRQNQNGLNSQTTHNNNNVNQSSNVFSSNADFLFQLYQQLPHQQQSQQQQTQTSTSSSLSTQNQQQPHPHQPHSTNNTQSQSQLNQFNKFQVPQMPTQLPQRSSEHLLGELVTTELLKMTKERRKCVQKRILEILFFDD